MSGLSIRGYARHRGCSQAAVQKALKEGRISRESDGSIDPARADREWRQNTTPRADVQGATGSATRRRAVAPAQPTFAEARRLWQLAQAERAQLALDQARGRLIALDDVERAYARLLHRIRANFLAAPGRYAPQFVCSCRDMAAATALLSDVVVNEWLGNLRDELLITDALKEEQDDGEHPRSVADGTEG